MLNKFTISSNRFLHKNIQAFYHSDYHGGGGKWREKGTIENVICTLKNDITPYTDSVLKNGSSGFSMERVGRI